MRNPLKRSVMFLALTGEEQDSWEPKFYATHPLHPLRRTVANLNLDGLNPWGRTRDVAVVGLGNSTLDDLAIREADRQGRVVTSEPMPERGRFIGAITSSSPRWAFRRCISKSGLDYLGRPRVGKAQADAFTERDYHKVSDEVKDDWDFSGAVEDLQILYRIGLELSQGPVWPEWKPGTGSRPSATP